MFFRRTTKPAAKPAPVKVKAPTKGVSKDGTRAITRRIEKPVSVEGRFYLAPPYSCDFAWEAVDHARMRLRGMSEEEIARKTGLSLFDVRRSLQSFPKYKQISEGEHDDWHLIKGKPRSIALDWWSHKSIIKEHITERSELMTVEQVARATGLKKALSFQYTIYWDANGETFSCRGFNRNGMLTVYREPAACDQPREYHLQVAELAKRMGR